MKLVVADITAEDQYGKRKVTDQNGKGWNFSRKKFEERIDMLAQGQCLECTMGTFTNPKDGKSYPFIDDFKIITENVPLPAPVKAPVPTQESMVARAKPPNDSPGARHGMIMGQVGEFARMEGGDAMFALYTDPETAKAVFTQYFTEIVDEMLG